MEQKIKLSLNIYNILWQEMINEEGLKGCNQLSGARLKTSHPCPWYHHHHQSRHHRHLANRGPHQGPRQDRHRDRQVAAWPGRL